MTSVGVKHVVLRVDGPCPCGSGKAIANCHLGLDGRLRKPVSSLRPPGTLTGFSHPGCYLKDSRDCSEQISREHYISKSVLNQMGDPLRVRGVPWLRPDETLETSIGSLTAKILCKRHNEALSPLDAEASHFFSVLRTALLDVSRNRRKPIFHLVGGETLQLWMLKVACGLYFAIGANDGIQLARTHAIDLAKVLRAFFERGWDARGGLYFRAGTGSVVNINPDIEISPLIKEKRFGGAVVSLHGLTLELLFDTTDTNPGIWAGIVRQPSELILKSKQREHRIIFTWPMGTPEASILLEENLGLPATRASTV
jgi:hypothetical protein